MKKKRLFVYSVDAMVQEDVAYLRDKPGSHFGRFYENCSALESVRTIYPSITYPAHVAIQTGCYPEKNGVYTNYIFNTRGDATEWTWDSRRIKTDTIFAAAKRGGYTTGAAFWPVTAYNAAIDFHMPEYWLAHGGETLRGTFMEMGASPQVADIMERHANLLPDTYWKTGKSNFTVEPNFDEFLVQVTCDIIRRCRPEVLFMHGSLVDSARHGFGIFSPQVNEALDQVDAWLGMLFDAFREAGTFEDTNFVILSDHGQMDAIRTARPNAVLAERGLIRLDGSGHVEDYTVYGMHNGHSMTFWLKNPADQAGSKRAYRTLCDMAAEGVYGFREVLTREEASSRFHLDGDFAFIAEGDGYTVFSDECVRPIITDIPLKDYRMGKGDHGHRPDRGPQPVFLAKGPDFRENVRLARREIVDEAPTFAKLLGVELRDAQGTAMTELLRES